MTVLTIVQRTMRLMGLVSTPILTVVNSTDATVQQAFELLREGASDMATDYDWQALRKEWTFVTTATPTQATFQPSDLDHFINDTFFNRTLMRKVFGPITPQTWQAIQAMPQLNSVFLAWVERTSTVLVTPTPPAGQTIAYEYITINWALANGSTPADDFENDADTTLLDERLLRLDLRWRFLQAKGLPWENAKQTFMENKDIEAARDGGNAVLDTTGTGSYNWGTNVPEGNFPG